MQEARSSLDAARKAQQSSKHQTSTGTPYPNSRSQQDARRQWVKRNSKPLEDIAVAAYLSTSAGAASAPCTAPLAMSFPRPQRRESGAAIASRKTKRTSVTIVERHHIVVPVKKAATETRSYSPEFTDMVSLFDCNNFVISYLHSFKD